MTSKRDFKVILFDLGGVLLKLRDPVTTFGLACDESEFLRAWIMSPSVRALESGSIDGEAFARQIVVEMDLAMDWRELLHRFNNWPENVYPKAVDLLGRIPPKFSCAILSNTNSVHWQGIDVRTTFGDRFDRYFLSYESGLLKPDRESFLQVTESYGCRPEEILFFDDNPVNVAAAGKEGIAAMRISGPDELEAALIDARVI